MGIGDLTPEVALDVEGNVEVGILTTGAYNASTGDLVVRRNDACGTVGGSCRALINDGSGGLILGWRSGGTNDFDATYLNGGIISILSGGSIFFNSGNDNVNSMEFDDDKVLKVPLEIETQKLEVAQIVHSEQGVTTQTIWGSCRCQSCDVLPYGPQNAFKRLVQFFTGEEACAAEACYELCNPIDAALCSTLGAGWNEIDSGIASCNNKLDCGGATSCGSTRSDYGTHVWRRCQGPAGAFAEATKLEFGYDAGLGENTTWIRDTSRS